MNATAIAIRPGVGRARRVHGHEAGLREQRLQTGLVRFRPDVKLSQETSATRRQTRRARRTEENELALWANQASQKR